MREIKNTMKNGQTVVGSFLWEFNVPVVPKIFANAGYDYVILDQEHGCFTYTDLQSMIQVAHGCDTAAIVRVPQISRECIQRYMDMGADGILVPMVNTVEQAKEVVRLAKYAPMGERGLAFCKGNMDYRMVLDCKPQDFMNRANKETIIFVQVETKESVKNLDSILEVDGIDGIFIGPMDLSSDMGIPGEFASLELEKTIHEVLDKTLSSGKLTGCFATDTRLLAKIKTKLNLVTLGTDSTLFYKGIHSELNLVRALFD